jgi:hypothetical protein
MMLWKSCPICPKVYRKLISLWQQRIERYNDRLMFSAAGRKLPVATTE